MPNEEGLGSLSDDRLIDRACDRFELAWREGQPVPIESIVEACPESIRSALITELIALEIELRRSQGGTAHPKRPGLEYDHIRIKNIQPPGPHGRSFLYVDAPEN